MVVVVGSVGIVVVVVGGAVVAVVVGAAVVGGTVVGATVGAFVAGTVVATGAVVATPGIDGVGATTAGGGTVVDTAAAVVVGPDAVVAGGSAVGSAAVVVVVARGRVGSVERAALVGATRIAVVVLGPTAVSVPPDGSAPAAKTPTKPNIVPALTTALTALAFSAGCGPRAAPEARDDRAGRSG